MFRGPVDCGTVVVSRRFGTDVVVDVDADLVDALHDASSTNTRPNANKRNGVSPRRSGTFVSRRMPNVSSERDEFGAGTLACSTGPDAVGSQLAQYGDRRGARTADRSD